jgi:hypothetical protein
MAQLIHDQLDPELHLCEIPGVVGGSGSSKSPPPGIDHRAVAAIEYIAALRAADDHDFTPLLEFARS